MNITKPESVQRGVGLLACCMALAFALLGASPTRAAGVEDLDCVIEASEVADLSSSVNDGIMSEVYVKRGEWVEKGQVVAQLESSVEQATVDLARAKAETVQLIQARQTRLDLANKRMKRASDLSKNKAIASQDVDEAETEQALAQIELEQAREDQRIARLELERAEKLLALRTITSPISGIVVEIYTSAGESVENQPIIRIAQIDPLYVEAIAPVKLFGAIAEGSMSQVFPEEPIGGQFPAKVSMVEPIVDAPSGTFGVRLILQNPDKALPAGLRCKLRFANGHGDSSDFGQ